MDGVLPGWAPPPLPSPSRLSAPGSPCSLAPASRSSPVSLAACQSAWEPPGGGVPKGCAESWSHDEAIGQGLGLSTHLSWGTDADATARRDFELSQWPWLGVRTARRDMYWSTAITNRQSVTVTIGSSPVFVLVPREPIPGRRVFFVTPARYPG